MQYIEYKHLDRSNWREGPWDNEPDKIQFQCPITGYRCLVVRGRKGHLCGYVAVECTHPLYEVDYCNDENHSVAGLKVHGGVTYTEYTYDDPDQSKSVQVYDPNYTHWRNLWWIGFDCNHSTDMSPCKSTYTSGEGIYRDVGYVVRELQFLAIQIHRCTEENVPDGVM